ncbi:hypothetical protein TWF718_002752 [Orbilia javanica]|uniref:Fucose-specific lectin n=1 Tax=Orbilia javanica TaxID=47235 RepID=A0AAN8MIV8_9PEZI
MAEIKELSLDDPIPGRNSNYSTIMGPNGAWMVVFFQTSLGEICVYRWTKESGKWDCRAISLIKDASRGTPLTAVGFSNGYVHLYYLKKVTQRFSVIQELVWTTDGQSEGTLNALNIQTAPESKLGAIQWGTYKTSGQIRLYYQNPDDTGIKEYGMHFKDEVPVWWSGKALPGSPLLGTYLSFVNTQWDTHIIRGFWQNDDGYIDEYHWQSGKGWTAGDFTPLSAPKLAAFTATVTVYDSGYKVLLFHVNRSIKKLEWTIDGGWKLEVDIDGDRVSPDSRLTAVGAFHSNHTIDQDEVYLYSSGEDNSVEERILSNGSWSAPTPINPSA